MRRSALSAMAFTLLMFGTRKEPDWQTGKVTDPPASVAEATSGNAARPKHHMESDPHIVTIQGSDFVYTAQEKHAWNSWCLLIMGDEVKYAREKGKLHLKDATGARCTFDVVKAEKLQ